MKGLSVLPRALFAGLLFFLKAYYDDAFCSFLTKFIVFVRNILFVVLAN